MNPEYAQEIKFVECNLQPVSESSLDLDFVSETSMWEWYGCVISVMGNMTMEMAQEEPNEFRFAFLKVPFEYDLSELEDE